MSKTNSFLENIYIRQYAAISVADSTPIFYGQACPFDKLPKRETRRLSLYEKSIISLLVGLDENTDIAPIVFASQYGSLGTHTLSLIKDILDKTPLSPNQFSLSVHNASIGIASQILNNTLGYTAIAAGTNSLQAGLIEAASRLLTSEKEITFVFAEPRLTDEYADFSNTNEDQYFACSLTSAPDPNCASLMELTNGASDISSANVFDSLCKVKL